jgi:hypothetical protein
MKVCVELKAEKDKISLGGPCLVFKMKSKICGRAHILRKTVNKLKLNSRRN